MASTILAEISRLDLLYLSTPPLASYWIEAPTPTIAVPGSPPLWSAPRAPRQLKKASGLIYIAQNAARHPDSPLESLSRALYIANPSFDIRSIDVVTDRNNMDYGWHDDFNDDDMTPSHQETARLPIVKSFLLCFDGTRTRGSSKEARPL